MILEIKDHSDLCYHLPTNFLTEATNKTLRIGKSFPIDISTRKLGDVGMAEVIKKSSVHHLNNLARVSKDLVNNLAKLVKDNSYDWPIEIPKK